MKYKIDHSTRLACFSPPVMLVTMLIEFGGALWLAWRYRLTRRARLAIAGLVCLGVFQLAEYLICEASGIDGLSWARIGHVAISLLPPIGVSLALELADHRSPVLETAIFCLCAGFIGYYGFWSGAITSETCQGNYVIFTGESHVAGAIYGLYYFSLLAVGTGVSAYYARRISGQRRIALWGLLIGYLTFIIPTTVIYLLDDSIRGGIPSIMCGFAVFLALMILGVAIPNGDFIPRVSPQTSPLWRKNA